MKQLVLLLVALVVAWGAPAQADLLFYDGFDYTVDEFLAPNNDTGGSPHPGQHNVAYNFDWRYAGPASKNAPKIGAGSLSLSSLLASTGNSVAFDMAQSGSSRIQTNSPAISTGTVYWSGLLRVGDVGTLNSTGTGALLGGFNNTPGPSATAPGVVGAVLRIRKDASDATRYNLGTAMNSGNALNNIQYSTTPLATGDTVFVVASYQFVSGANNDIARMWINPSSSDFGAGAAPTPTLTSQPLGTVADSFASLSTFNLRNVDSVGLPTGIVFDELRIGTDWASVTPAAVPEASSGLFLLVGSVLLAGRSKAVKPLFNWFITPPKNQQS